MFFSTSRAVASKAGESVEVDERKRSVYVLNEPSPAMAQKEADRTAPVHGFNFPITPRLALSSARFFMFTSAALMCTNAFSFSAHAYGPA